MLKRFTAIIGVLLTLQASVFANETLIEGNKALSESIQPVISDLSLNRNIIPSCYANIMANDPNTSHGSSDEAMLNRGKYVATNHKAVLFKFDLGNSNDYQTAQVYLKFTSKQLSASYDFGYYVYAIPKTISWDENFTYTNAINAALVVNYYEKPANQEPSMVYQVDGTAPKTVHKIDVTRLVRDDTVNNNGVVTFMIEALSDLKATSETLPANIYTQNASSEEERPSLFVANEEAPKIYKNLASIMPALDTYYYYNKDIPARMDAVSDSVKNIFINAGSAYNRVGLMKFNLKDMDEKILNSNLIELEYFEGSDVTGNGHTYNAGGDVMHYITALTSTDISKISGTSYNSLKSVGYIADTDVGKYPKNPIIVAKSPISIYAGKGGVMYNTKRTVDVTEYVKNISNQFIEPTGNKFVMFRFDNCSSVLSSIRSSEFGSYYSPKLIFTNASGRKTTDYVVKTTKSISPTNSVITRGQWATGAYPAAVNIQFKDDKVTPDVRNGFLEFPITASANDIQNADDIKLEFCVNYKTGATYAPRNMYFDIYSVPSNNIPAVGLAGLTYNSANSIGMLSKGFKKLNGSSFTAYNLLINASNPYNIFEQRFRIDVTDELKSKIANAETLFVIRMDDLLRFSGSTVVDISGYSETAVNKAPKLVLNIPQYTPVEPTPIPVENKAESIYDTYVDKINPNVNYGAETKLVADLEKYALMTFPIGRITPALQKMNIPTISIRSLNSKNGIGKLYKLNNATFKEDDTYSSLNSKGIFDLNNATLVTAFNIKEGSDRYELDLSSIINDIKACSDTISFMITTDNYAEFYSQQSFIRPTFIANEIDDDNESVNFASQNIMVPISNVISDFYLPTLVNAGVSVNWTSLNNDIIKIEGDTAKIIIPDTTQDVKLSATLSKNGATTTNTYDMTVLGKDYYNSLMQKQYDLLDIANKFVTSDFVLPQSTNDLISVSWTSNNEIAIKITGNNATVSRGDNDSDVILTANIRVKNNLYITPLAKEILVRVQKKPVIKGGSVGEGTPIVVKTVKPTFVSPTNVTESNDIKKGLTFKDVSKDFWAFDYIANLYEKDIISGVDKEHFEPNRNVTKEEFVKLLVDGFKINNNSNLGIPFAEIPKDYWANEYINQAYTSKIVFGLPDGSFGLGQNVTRQDVAVMVYRTLISKGYKFEKHENLLFDDNADIDSYALDAIYSLKDTGILSGSNNRYRPKDFVSRAEVTKIISLAIKIMN